MKHNGLCWHLKAMAENLWSKGLECQRKGRNSLATEFFDLARVNARMADAEAYWADSSNRPLTMRWYRSSCGKAWNIEFVEKI